ncbi:hypothetical protein [Shimia ponticola]|uniref:hypothetical protein n=1 Tax=Shimia ponticola TaxID=2582893 RepID=UPI0011BF5E13|nr:hypothetical protein [Shimia ponticola]
MPLYLSPSTTDWSDHRLAIKIDTDFVTVAICDDDAIDCVNEGKSVQMTRADWDLLSRAVAGTALPIEESA